MTFYCIFVYGRILYKLVMQLTQPTTTDSRRHSIKCAMSCDRFHQVHNPLLTAFSMNSLFSASLLKRTILTFPLGKVDRVPKFRSKVNGTSATNAPLCWRFVRFAAQFSNIMPHFYLDYTTAATGEATRWIRGVCPQKHTKNRH